MKKKNVQPRKKSRQVKYDRRPAWKRILELMLMALAVNWLFPMGWREIWPRRLQAFQEKLSK